MPSRVYGSIGNAKVPSDAAIQPPQAFVNVMMVGTFQAIDSISEVDWSNKGITSIDTSTNGYFYTMQIYYEGTSGTGLQINISGNALNLATVNGILAMLALRSLGPFGRMGVLDISGGASAAPSGQGITDKATLVAHDWTITTN